MARGKDDFADGVVDHKISISEYPLSASVACGKVRGGGVQATRLKTDQWGCRRVVLLRAGGAVGHCMMCPPRSPARPPTLISRSAGYINLRTDLASAFAPLRHAYNRQRLSPPW